MSEPTDRPIDSEFASAAAKPSASLFPHLAQAPIQEAAIYFQTPLPPEFDVSTFKPLFQSDRMAGYVRMDEAHNYEQTFNFDLNTKQGSHGVKDKGLDRIIFHSADNLNVAQFGRGGFTFTRLRPYTSWEQIFAEAWRLWQIFREFASPTQLSRIGVRYINRLAIPLESNDLAQYLAAPPPLAPSWPQGVMSFLNQVVLQVPEYEAIAQLTQVLEPRTDNSVLPIILDIDVYAIGVLNPANPNLAGRFAQFREAKNGIFFGAFTPKTISLFEPQ